MLSEKYAPWVYLGAYSSESAKYHLTAKSFCAKTINLLLTNALFATVHCI